MKQYLFLMALIFGVGAVPMTALAQDVDPVAIEQELTSHPERFRDDIDLATYRAHEPASSAADAAETNEPRVNQDALGHDAEPRRDAEGHTWEDQQRKDEPSH